MEIFVGKNGLKTEKTGKSSNEEKAASQPNIASHLRELNSPSLLESAVAATLATPKAKFSKEDPIKSLQGFIGKAAAFLTAQKTVEAPGQAKVKTF